MTWSEHRSDSKVTLIAEQELNTFVGGNYRETNCCRKTTIAWWRPEGFIVGKRHSGCADTGMVELIDELHWRRRLRARAPRRTA